MCLMLGGMCVCGFWCGWLVVLLAERLTLSDAIDLICAIIYKEFGLNVDYRIF